MNGTSTFPSADIFRYCVYIVEGFLLVVFNGLLVATITKHKALRTQKEYVIIGGLAGADAISGFGTFLAGIYRIYRLLVYGPSPTFVPRQCIYGSPHLLLWLFGAPLQAVMLLGVSIDRLVLVARPTVYLGLTNKYGWMLVLIGYGYCMVQTVVLVVRVWPSEVPVTALCDTGKSILKVDYGFYFTSMTTFSLSAIVVYICLLLVYKKRMGKVEDGTTDRELQQRAQRQWKLTRTLAISCGFTFVFYAVPTIIINLASVMNLGLFWRSWFWIICNINPLFNLFIFLYKHSEIRVGLRNLFFGDPLPGNLALWKKSQATASTANVKVAGYRSPLPPRSRRQSKQSDVGGVIEMDSRVGNASEIGQLPGAYDSRVHE